MLRGSVTTTFDKSGRLRIPAKFRKIIEEKYGKEVFITSFDMKTILIYPLAEWDKFASIICERIKEDPKIRRLALRINRLGIKTEIDNYGMVMIYKLLRDKINLKGKMVVEGMGNHLVLKQAS